MHQDVCKEGIDDAALTLDAIAHEPGTTAVVDKLGSKFSAGRLPTDYVG